VRKRIFPVQRRTSLTTQTRKARKKKPPRWVWWLLPVVVAILLLLMGFYAFAWARWIQPRVRLSPTVCGAQVPELAVHLSYPRYLAIGDVGEIDVTVVNRATQTLTGTVTLAFDQAIGVHVADDEETVLRFKDLPGGGQVTDHVKFYWNTQPRLGDASASSFRLRVSLTGGGLYETDAQTVTVAPVPYLALALARGGALLAGLVGLLGGQIEKRLFPSA
jgi:hypothetical protein